MTVRPGAALIEIALANGRELRAPMDVDPAQLATIVAALEA